MKVFLNSQNDRNSGGSQANPSYSYPFGANDPELQKLIEYQLVMLLHAAMVPGHCGLQHCSTMNEALDHINGCRNSKHCQDPYCGSSQLLIGHWKSCKQPLCLLCTPIRIRIKNGVNPGLASFIIRPQSNEMNNRMTAPQFTSAATMQPTSNAPKQPSEVQDTKPVVTFATNTPYYPRTIKTWHQDISTEMRSHLINRLFGQAILTAPVHNVRMDKRLLQLISYAREQERDIFEYANDRDHYYQLATEKMHNIQKELEEKKLSRKQTTIKVEEESQSMKRTKLSPA